MCSARDNVALPTLGFPIRASAGHWPFSASPRLIAAVHALHRLLVPRHPPCALTILTVISGRALRLRPVIPVSLATVQFSRSARRRDAGSSSPRSPGEPPANAPVSQNSTACGRLRGRALALKRCVLPDPVDIPSPGAPRSSDGQCPKACHRIRLRLSRRNARRAPGVLSRRTP